VVAEKAHSPEVAVKLFWTSGGCCWNQNSQAMRCFSSMMKTEDQHVPLPLWFVSDAGFVAMTVFLQRWVSALETKRDKELLMERHGSESSFRDRAARPTGRTTPPTVPHEPD
jgi:hypothetical protein